MSQPATLNDPILPLCALNVKERADEARVSLAEGRRSLAALAESMESLQSELSQSELRREHVETELASTQEVRQTRGREGTQEVRPGGEGGVAVSDSAPGGLRMRSHRSVIRDDTHACRLSW